ncbi:MAG: hypothetical protein AAFZ52_18425, partial [Bacteroidota bacterium]
EVESNIYVERNPHQNASLDFSPSARSGRLATDMEIISLREEITQLKLRLKRSRSQDSLHTEQIAQWIKHAALLEEGLANCRSLATAPSP